MNTSITFSVYVDFDKADSPQLVPENNLAELKSISRKWTTNNDIKELDACLGISCSSNYSIRLCDDLMSVALGFCLYPLDNLTKGEKAFYRYCTSSDTIELISIDSNIKISGQYISSIECPSRQLISEMFYCGKRIYQFYYALWSPKSGQSHKGIEYLGQQVKIKEELLINKELLDL